MGKKRILGTLLHPQFRTCAALPDSLLESELFGYGRGAFTGTHASNPGKLQQAQASCSRPRGARPSSTRSASNWNKSQAAQELHWSRMTLYGKMARYHLREAVGKGEHGSGGGPGKL